MRRASSRSSFVLSRLHARYTRDAPGDDLVFREAPPITGGREMRGADGALETAAVVQANREYATNAFQGRYAVRHGWAGPIACVTPVRNVWGGPPDGLDNGGAKPAVGLAYAPRGNVQLASFLRTDVAALDLKAEGAPPTGVGTFTLPATAPPALAGPTSDGGAGGADGGVATTGAKRSGCAGCSSASSSMGDAGALLAGLAGLVLMARRRSRREARGRSRAR